MCVEINAEIGKKKIMGMARSGISNDLEVRDLTKLDQHVNEMMTTAGILLFISLLA